MNPSFFTIVIPTFNSGATLDKAISSVLIQGFEDFEIIVVDGVSKDNTIDIVEAYQKQDDRISYISEPDGGVYDGMNKGITNSSGSWLLFLGSDDVLYNDNTLADVAGLIAANPGTRFVYGDVLTSRGYLQRYDNYDYLKLLDTCICHQCILYHRSLFDDFLYDMTFNICADWDFNLKVFKRENNPLYIGVPIAIFNLNGLSNNWQKHPEYLRYFADKIKSVGRYRRGIPLLYYQFLLILKAFLRIPRKVKKRLFVY